MASTLIERAGPLCRLRHVVVDGHFGTNNVMQMVRQELVLHLVSKLRHDSALYFLYEGPQKPAGRKRIYGGKIAPAADAISPDATLMGVYAKGINLFMANLYKVD